MSPIDRNTEDDLSEDELMNTVIALCPSFQPLVEWVSVSPAERSFVIRSTIQGVAIVLQITSETGQSWSVVEEMSLREATSFAVIRKRCQNALDLYELWEK
jgi:hypothetical protein